MFVIKEGSEGDKFWEVCVDDVEEFRPGDCVEHVGEVDKYCCPCWCVVALLWLGNEAVDRKLHTFDDEIHSAGDADCIIVW